MTHRTRAQEAPIFVEGISRYPLVRVVGADQGLARSRSNAVEHSRLGCSPTGRFCGVHDWPVFRCPPRRLLTERLEQTPRFQLVSARQFTNTVREMRESLDGSLTETEKLDVVQKAARTLNADAALILEVTQPGRQPRPGQLVSGITGRMDQTNTYRLRLVSTETRSVLWQQTLKLEMSAGAYSVPSRGDIAKAAITPLADNFLTTFRAD